MTGMFLVVLCQNIYEVRFLLRHSAVHNDLNCFDSEVKSFEMDQFNVAFVM